MRFDRVSRRARNLGDDRALGAKQRVEERRLACVGTARDDEQRPLAEPLAFGSGFQEVAHTIPHYAPRGAHPLRTHGTLIFLRKVDLVRDQRLELEDLAAQGGQAIGQAALELVQRATALRRRARVYQVRRRLGL